MYFIHEDVANDDLEDEVVVRDESIDERLWLVGSDELGAGLLGVLVAAAEGGGLVDEGLEVALGGGVGGAARGGAQPGQDQLVIIIV